MTAAFRWITLLLFISQLCAISRGATPHTLSRSQRILTTASSPPPPAYPYPTAGPCSTTHVVALAVHVVSDIYARQHFTDSTTVILEFYANLTLTSPLILDRGYACTILRPSASVTSPIWITAASDTFYPFMINSTSNILVQNINFYIPFNGRPGYLPPVNCHAKTSMSHSFSCPAVLVDRSWGVEMKKCSIYGRLDVIRTVNSLFDSLKVVSPNMNQSNGLGVVQLLTGGDPVNLISSNLTLSNSDISGGMNGIMLTYQIVGARVVNNFVHNYTQQGIQCGQGVHNVADCLNSYIAYNYVLTEPFVNSTGDAAGLYFDTHWTGIGNTLRCNYVEGGGHCVYLDYATSHVRVKGGVCINGGSAIKINTGKNNVISSLIIKSGGASTSFGGLSNQNYQVNNCLLDPGVNWTNTLTKTYLTSPSSPWAIAAPQLIDFCAQTTVTWNGTVQQCNPIGGDASGSYPTAAQSGKCSGLPTSNYVNAYMLDSPASTFRKYNNLYPAPEGGMLSTGYVFAMNTIDVLHYTNISARVYNARGGDYGVKKRSPMRGNRHFVSCPRKRVGIQPQSNYGLGTFGFNSHIAGAHVFAIMNRQLPGNYPKDGYHLDTSAQLGGAATRVVGHHAKSGHHLSGGHHNVGGHHHH